MVGASADLVVRVAANISGLQADMAAATATVTTFETTVAAAAPPLQQVEAALTNVGTAASASGEQLSDAAVKMRALLGETTQLATVTEETAASTQTFRGGLNDIAEGAGVTFGEMGLLGSATLALGVGMAAFNFTRWVVGFTNIDDAVAKASARLLGFGDVVAQSAGAKQDVITLAIKRGAEAAITYADALKFNAEWFVKWQAQAKDMDDVAARIHAPQELAEQMRKWNAEIELVRSAGALPALTAGLNSHVISVKELSASYRISEGAINLFKQQLAEEATAHTKATAEANKHAAELRHLMDEVQKIEDEKDAFTLKGFEKLNQAEAVANMTRMKNMEAGYAQIQKAEGALADARAKLTLSSADYQVKKIWDVVTEQEAAFKGTLEQRAQYNAAVEALAQQQADVLIAKARQTEAELLTIVVGHGPDAPNAGAGRTSGGGGGIALPPDVLASLAGMSGLSRDLEASRQVKLRGFKDGGPVLTDGPIYAHAGEYVVPKDQAGATGGVTVNLTMHVNGTGADVARIAVDALTKTLKQGRLLPSA